MHRQKAWLDIYTYALVTTAALVLGCAGGGGNDVDAGTDGGSTPDSSLPACGNRIPEGTEECDDGNSVP